MKRKWSKLLPKLQEFLDKDFKNKYAIYYSDHSITLMTKKDADYMEKVGRELQAELGGLPPV